MKKLLVTGAGGYIGSIACLRFLQEGFEVVGIDNFSAGFQQPLKHLENTFGAKAFRFYSLDLLLPLDTLFEKEKDIDSVIHLAGVCSVDESVKNPHKYFSNNTFASQNLLEAMRKHDIPRLIFSSSCSIYKDLPVERPRHEKDMFGPSTPYGESKLMAEKTIEWYAQLFGIQYIILRYFNVCGAAETGELGDSKKPSTLLVHNAILGALDVLPFELTFPKVSTPDGSPVRDYIDVLDIIDAHLKSFEYLEKKELSDVFNLGTGVGRSVLEVIHAVEEITGRPLNYKEGSQRAGDYPQRVASWKKAKKLLNWKPTRSLDQSIIHAMKWYKNHPQRWL